MAMSTVAPKRDKTIRFRRAPRDRSSRVPFYLAGLSGACVARPRPCGGRFTCEIPKGTGARTPHGKTPTRRRAVESLVRLRNSAQFMFRRANGAIDLLSANEAERLRRQLERRSDS